MGLLAQRLYRRASATRGARLLQGRGRVQERGFVEVPGYQLDPNRKSLSAPAKGHRDSRGACQVGRQRSSQRVPAGYLPVSNYQLY